VERDDLAAMFALITKRLTDAERPILSGHGLTMWQYIVLSQLERGPAPTQLALAAAIEHDKTRLIAVLDGLEADGLVNRRPDPTDRRARVVEITKAGRTRVAAARAQIRAMEDEVLAGLSARQRTSLLDLLPRLVGRDET
jgi:DNA-binding MarR family transcriptional regulator